MSKRLLTPTPQQAWDVLYCDDVATADRSYVAKWFESSVRRLERWTKTPLETRQMLAFVQLVEIAEQDGRPTPFNVVN